jgi:hypothetical protein
LSELPRSVLPVLTAAFVILCGVRNGIVSMFFEGRRIRD